MKITVLGAAGGEVTGSCYLVETGTARVLVDCGIFQGGPQAEARNRARDGLPSGRLDAVVLTHAHLDHTGRLPLLVKYGLDCPVYGTTATGELSALVLRDAARLQAQEADYHNRKRLHPGEAPQQPLYSIEETETLIGRFRSVAYQTPVEVAPGIRAIWAEAGHMLGSASIQLLVAEGPVSRRVVFSGDLGPKGVPILRDYEPFKKADLVFLESTYGDRDHRPFKETVAEFLRLVQEAVAERGKILVPTFAIGRAQLLTLLLGGMFRSGELKPFPLFLDSPMAIEASRIYQRHPELFDDEMTAFIKARPLAADLKSLRTTPTAEESKQINDVPGPCLVMAGSGMCTGGRIVHHLKHGLGRPETRVLIVGFQSRGSLGRRLVDGEKLVTIHGEPITVRAQVHTLGGFSAHAGRTELLGWFDCVAAPGIRVALTHGEDQARTALAAGIRERHGIDPWLPALGETVDL